MYGALLVSATYFNIRSRSCSRARCKLAIFRPAVLKRHLYFEAINYASFNLSEKRNDQDFSLVIVQQDATYSVYYISVGSSTGFEC